VEGGAILVVGATGRVGGAAVRYLLDAGYEVRALVRSAGKGENLRSLGAEILEGDVTKPGTLAPALDGCAGVFSALSSTTEREAEEVEYRGNVNLLSAARGAGVRRFVYNSALLVDHPLAQGVGTFREKARFEEALLGAGDLSATVLRPVMFMETLLMALSGPVAFVPGRQRRNVGWISTSDVARAAVAAFEREVTGRYELAGPETLTYEQIVKLALDAWGRARPLIHVPLPVVRRALALIEAVSGDAAFATWEEAQLMEIRMTSSAGTKDARTLGIEPKPMREVLGLAP
jgi:uncharacterized protein YbjT (DUF2867 family)